MWQRMYERDRHKENLKAEITWTTLAHQNTCNTLEIVGKITMNVTEKYKVLPKWNELQKIKYFKKIFNTYETKKHGKMSYIKGLKDLVLRINTNNQK